MTALAVELIRKTKAGTALSKDEIQSLVQDYTQGRLPDYQMAAWLMAVCWRGLTPQETADLTAAMMHSGRVLNFKNLHKPCVDKHSTGGVGDKTSLLVAPIVAAAGVPVPMIAGRGLAHTGGTLDKLESISGFNVRLDLPTFTSTVARVGTALIGQTEEICPADRKMYALRDVTGTVDSLPLICASIMSKKLAEGLDGLVLDVKFGSGAFMKTLPEAERLALALQAIGRSHGVRVTALLTDMQQPLGRFVGNALEVKECLDILQGQTGCSGSEGKDYSDTIELSLVLAGHMLFLGDVAKSASQGTSLAREILDSGKAWTKFQEICQTQSGDLSRPLPTARRRTPVPAPASGYVAAINTEALGMACIYLKAGRKTVNDQIDYSAGIEVLLQIGDPVRQGAPMFYVYSSEDPDEAVTMIQQTVTITSSTCVRPPLIAKVLST